MIRYDLMSYIEHIHDKILNVARIPIEYFFFMLHTGFIFDQIWCISTKLRICIRDVHILDRIQKRIFRDSGYFCPEDIYGTQTCQNQNIVCILVHYIVFMMYVGLIFDQILCISTKLRICIRKVCILDRIKKRIFGILALFAQ